jgi:hypothetical protein
VILRLDKPVTNEGRTDGGVSQVCIPRDFSKAMTGYVQLADYLVSPRLIACDPLTKALEFSYELALTHMETLPNYSAVFLLPRALFWRLGVDPSEVLTDDSMSRLSFCVRGATRQRASWYRALFQACMFPAGNSPSPLPLSRQLHIGLNMRSGSRQSRPESPPACGHRRELERRVGQ